MTVNLRELYGSNYLVEEVARVSGIPERTLWRWRANGLLTTTPDWENDPRGMGEVLAGRGSIRMVQLAKFSVEDVVRLLVISHLAATYGLDRQVILVALGHPYAIDIQPGREPGWLVVYPEDGGKLTRLATSDFTEPELKRLFQIVKVGPLSLVVPAEPLYFLPLAGFRKSAVEALRKFNEKPEVRQRGRRKLA